MTPATSGATFANERSFAGDCCVSRVDWHGYQRSSVARFVVGSIAWKLTKLQVVSCIQGSDWVEFVLPDSDTHVVPGVEWGRPDELFTPAYWAAIARTDGSPLPEAHRLGSSLLEEVAACILGGYGIPAELGLAAFARIRDAGLLNDPLVGESAIFEALSVPLTLGTRVLRYRFARQKSHYLAGAIRVLRGSEPLPLTSGRALRDWLLQIDGVGWKTASWIARNWLDADDVAILDVHILRAGLLAGLFHQEEKVPRDYMTLERRFLDLASAIGTRPSTLDALMWRQMRSSPHLVTKCLRNQPRADVSAR
jgi:N-glycosylase/DNA lyase